jgi:hypothetical protein
MYNDCILGGLWTCGLMAAQVMCALGGGAAPAVVCELLLAGMSEPISKAQG